VRKFQAFTNVEQFELSAAKKRRFVMLDGRLQQPVEISGGRTIANPPIGLAGLS
jgi:hypothetical protein